jgi:protein-tyrosine-phosphatase
MQTERSPRVLVLDGDMVPALTIARSLRKRGCDIDVASHEERPITSRSRAVNRVLRYPDPLSSEEDFLDWLEPYLREESYALVIPVTERSLVPISNHRGRFAHAHLAMPAAHSLELALDKGQTMELAARVGVPVPGGVAIESMADLEQQLQQLTYPVVLKPARSLGTHEGGSSQLKVSYAFDEFELRSGCEHGLMFGPVLLQQYFRGQGVGVELIAENGRIAYAFQHLRLHEVPLTGGGSSLRKSVPIEPRLLDASRRLIEALEWNGVAMVEFKFNPDSGEFCLMEINGRFWGSLPLADAAGADFPSMLLDLELEGAVRPCAPYRPDVYCRKLASDLYWYEAVLRRGPESRIADIPDNRTIVRELGLFFSPRHYFDVQSLRDPLPGLVDIGAILASYCQRLLALFEEGRFLRRQRRAWRRGEVRRALNDANSLLFVCYGNINRSAVADRMTRGYAADSGVRVCSAGFHQQEGRPADPVMIAVAAERGVDLRDSRSIQLTPDLLRQSDVIFAMERSHVERISAMDPAALERTWLLGAHRGNPRSPPEIADPYGRSRAAYEHCFQRIAESVDQIKGVLALRHGE